MKAWLSRRLAGIDVDRLRARLGRGWSLARDRARDLSSRWRQRLPVPVSLCRDRWAVLRSSLTGAGEAAAGIVRHSLAPRLAGVAEALRPASQWLVGTARGERRCGPCQSLRERWAALQDRIARLRQPEETADVVEEGTQALLFRARDYPRSRNRNYLVHVPQGYDGATPLPLVMVLHGCRQTHRDIRRVTNFDAVADKYGVLAVYPFITSYSGLRFRNCWGFWYPRETAAGAGEVEDLWQIIGEVRQRFNVDSQRIHVAGLSSGAGMAAALLVARADRIASGAVVAGVPYSETASAVGFLETSLIELKPVYQVAAAMRRDLPQRGRPVPIFIAHSHHDETVPIQAARNIRDSWGHCFDVDTLNPRRTRSGVSRGTPWTHKAYGHPAARSLIETFFIAGKGHGWYGGHAGPYSYPDAPDISRRIWLFFDRHRL